MIGGQGEDHDRCVCLFLDGIQVTRKEPLCVYLLLLLDHSLLLLTAC